MIDLSVIRNVHTICHERHDMNLKQKATGETTHLKHQELNRMHSECCKCSGGYVSMMPFVYVFVDEFHVNIKTIDGVKKEKNRRTPLCSEELFKPSSCP